MIMGGVRMIHNDNNMRWGTCNCSTNSWKRLFSWVKFDICSFTMISRFSFSVRALKKTDKNKNCWYNALQKYQFYKYLWTDLLCAASSPMASISLLKACFEKSTLLPSSSLVWRKSLFASILTNEAEIKKLRFSININCGVSSYRDKTEEPSFIIQFCLHITELFSMINIHRWNWELKKSFQRKLISLIWKSSTRHHWFHEDS